MIILNVVGPFLTRFNDEDAGEALLWVSCKTGDGKMQTHRSRGLADVRAATLKGFAAGDVVTPALRLKSYKMYFFFSFHVRKW